MLTAVGDAVPTTTYSHAEGMSMEAEDFIAKPVDAATLLEAVERLL
jgi:FixJ family two-component response regulator